MLLCSDCLTDADKAALWPLKNVTQQAFCRRCGKARECIDAPQPAIRQAS